MRLARHLETKTWEEQTKELVGLSWEKRLTGDMIGTLI